MISFSLFLFCCAVGSKLKVGTGILNLCFSALVFVQGFDRPVALRKVVGVNPWGFDLVVDLHDLVLRVE